ncbi:MAG: redox-sensing transcriptional repressor Rex [Acidimicrobiia bacterium]|nr:MAG: redox-sensing transcriptional repressor Rex [Acidimicrobiia bacterium]
MASIPPATVARLPLYLRSLADLPSERSTCSSEELALLAGVQSAQVRKDLSLVGLRGVRGVGYDIDGLHRQLTRLLGLDHEYRVVIVGAGNLGRALADFAGFREWGFTIVGLLDNDPDKIGTTVAGVPVNALSDLDRVIDEGEVSIAIIATPPGAAQDVAERLAQTGVRSILNFATTVLRVDGIDVRRVDLSSELQILAHHLNGPSALEEL